MHALLVTVKIDEGHAEEAQQTLEERIVPIVKQMPGVVSGVWAQTADGREGSSIVVFSSEDEAVAAKDQVGQMPNPDFVHIGNVEVRKVAAHF